MAYKPCSSLSVGLRVAEKGGDGTRDRDKKTEAKAGEGACDGGNREHVWIKLNEYSAFS